MEQQYLVSFSIDGIGGSSSYLTVKDGKVDTASVEDEFYSMLRKSEKALIKDSQDTELSYLIENLTTEQEDKLKEAHAENYIGTDDDMPDAYESWLMDLDLDQLKGLLK